jgi:SAM-dependent methyltransferase
MPDGMATYEGGHTSIHRNGREKGKAGNPVMARSTVGWQQTCDCNAEVVPATVLDPFAGSGTTLAVAQRLGRRGIGTDLSAEYLDLASTRVGKVALPLF